MGAGQTSRHDEGGSGGTVSEQATKMKETGRRELRDQLDERSTQVGQQAKSFADVLRRSGEEAQQSASGGMQVERLTTGVADRLERAGGYLEGAKGEEMLRDAERFVRERPWVVAGAAAAAGFAVSRILKASSERRYESRSTGMAPASPYPGQTTPPRPEDRSAELPESLQPAGAAY